MFGFCDEIEIAQEFETCKEIHERWPHLVEPHLKSLHEDIQDQVRHKWRVYVGADRQRYEMDRMMARAFQDASRQAFLNEHARLDRGVYSNPLGPPPYSLTGLHLGLGL